MIVRALLVIMMIVVPFVSEAANTDTVCTEKEVHFYSGPGLKLTGIITIPAGAKEDAKKYPAVVLCQGPGGYNMPDVLNMDPVMPAVSKLLCRAGYVTLRFCYRGVGPSEGPAYRLIPLEQVEDIRNAVTFLQQQREVDTARIGLFGLATGGANVSYTAAVDKRVKCMVSVNGMGDLGRWMREIRRYWEWLDFNKAVEEDRIGRVLTGTSRLVEQSTIILNDPKTDQHRKEMEEKFPELTKKNKPLLSLESAEALAAFYPERMVHMISPRAAMWICAEHDTLLPPAHSRIMYENAGEPKKLVVVQDEEHHSLYFREGFDKVMTHTTKWFNSHLKK